MVYKSVNGTMEYTEVQNNEVEALKAIYGSDFKELAVQSVWNRRPPPKFQILLRPSSDFEGSPIEVTVEVTMTATYPKTLPKIELCRSTALSGRQLETLKVLATQTMQEMRENEMVFEVTSNLQNQIDEWARSVSEAAPSLEEDRLRRLRIEEDRQRDEQDEIQRLREAKAKQEEKRYDSLILEEFKRNKTADSQRSASADNMLSLLVFPVTAPGITTFDRKITVSQPFVNFPVEFRQVSDGVRVSGPQFGTSYMVKALIPRGSVPSNGGKSLADITTEPDTILSLLRIGLSSPYWRSSAGARSLHDLNSELELIKQVHHPGVLPLSEFSIVCFNDKQKWEITLVTPGSRLTELSQLLNSTEKINLKTTQAWAYQILETLESLHKTGLRHKYICPYNVLIYVHPATGETMVVLRHPQYLFTLHKLNEEHPFIDEIGAREMDVYADNNSLWLPPEARIQSLSRRNPPSSKWDIWQLGALLTLMIVGRRELHNNYPEQYLKSRPRQIPTVLSKFLLSMLQADPSRRPGALELLTDQFFRTNFELHSDDLDSEEVSVDGSTESTHPAAPSLPPTMATANLVPATGNALGTFGRRRLSNNDDCLSFSRYKHDFDEGIVLGKGGFGQVVKARNKLDGRVYAVKKIRATPSTLSHILQEVVLLSRLNHQYVVRYYTVWLEDEVETVSDSTATLRQQESISNSTTTDNRESYSSALNPATIMDAITSASISQFSAHHSLSELDMPGVSQDYMSDSGFIEFGWSESESDSRINEVDENSLSVQPLPPPPSIQYSRKRRQPEKLLLERLARVTRKTLYIQMEYCENHTLGDLVRQGLYKEPQEYWRLLRQILDALAYIHGEGVIHRDLKPKNIFIDQTRNIKIGDFGLARSMVQPLQSVKPNADSTTPPSNTPPPTASNLAGSNSVETSTPVSANSPVVTNTEYEEFTTDVGTSLYAAVEITTKDCRKRGYNEKVDIFSLGIIFFEMIWNMSTEMERIQGIKRARSPQIELPAELLANKDKAVEVSLIKSMLDHDPRNRPSAHGLLKSGRIPVEDEDMTVLEALHNFKDPKVVQQLVNALFSRPLVSAQQVLYDRTNVMNLNRRQKPRVGDILSSLTSSYVNDTLKSVFKAHGAVENTLFRSRIFPRSVLYKGSTVVELIDAQGTVLQLPHDLTLPHARRLAEIVPEYKKVCAVDTIYRNHFQDIGHHPAKHIEVDFDIMSTDDSEEVLTFDEAETIAVMYDAASTVLSSTEPCDDLVVVVGHHDILSAALSHCGLSPPQYYAALLLLTSTNSMGGDRRCASPLARSNVSAASLDMLNQFAFRESLDMAEQRMSRLMPLSERVRRGLARVRAVAEMFFRLCTTHKEPQIYFSPLIHSIKSDFYINGLVFQLVEVKNIQSAARQFGSGSVLAMGGRYDSLVKSFRNNMLDNHTPLVRAVGFGMSADKLEAMVGKPHRQAKAPIPARCQVFVSSLSDYCLRTQGVDVARMLWSFGISADIVWEILSTEEIVDRAQAESVPIAVIVKQTHYTAGNSTSNTFKPLRVKRIAGGTSAQDVDLAMNELVPFIQSALSPDLFESVEINSELNTAVTSGGTNTGDMSANKVMVINESGRLKGGRKNRWQLEEKSFEAKTNFLTELANAPAVALDLRDEVILAIQQVSPFAVEDWKRRVAGLQPNQKAYIMTVQAKLANEATRSSRMLLYSTKTEHVFVYDC